VSKTYLAFKELDVLPHTLRIHELLEKFVRELADPLPAAHAVDEWCKRLICRATTEEQSAALWNEGIVQKWVNDPASQETIARKHVRDNSDLAVFIERTSELHHSLKVDPGEPLPPLPAQEIPMYQEAVGCLGFRFEGGSRVLNLKEVDGASDGNRNTFIGGGDGEQADGELGSGGGNSSDGGSSSSRKQVKRSERNTSEEGNSPNTIHTNTLYTLHGNSPSRRGTWIGVYGRGAKLWAKHRQRLVTLGAANVEVTKLQEEAKEHVKAIGNEVRALESYTH
jgi:hypothetical protein